MDEATRGYIEKTIDDVLRTGDIMPDIQWLLDTFPTKSPEDLALGHAIGLLTAAAGWAVIFRGKQITQEDKADIIRMLQRRLPEIREKIARELGR